MTLIDKIAWLRIEDDAVLCVRSRDRQAWYLPGGKREPGEEDLDTLVRETGEELGVTVLRDTARHAGTFEAQADARPDGVTVRMACYTADYHGALRPGHEIAEMGWFRYADRDRLSHAARLVLERVREQGLLR